MHCKFGVLILKMYACFEKNQDLPVKNVRKRFKIIFQKWDNVWRTTPNTTDCNKSLNLLEWLSNRGYQEAGSNFSIWHLVLIKKKNPQKHTYLVSEMLMIYLCNILSDDKSRQGGGVSVKIKKTFLFCLAKM